MAKLQGPLKPIGRDTQGNVVTYPDIESEQKYSDKGVYSEPILSGGKVLRPGGVYPGGIGGYSGGGGQSTSFQDNARREAQRQANLEAERKRQAELLAKLQKERDEKQRELREAREQKIQSGKIGGQLSKGYQTKEGFGTTPLYDKKKNITGGLSEQNIQALGTSISETGYIDPELEKQLSKRGYEVKEQPLLYRRAGETDLQYQKRKQLIEQEETSGLFGEPKNVFGDNQGMSYLPPEKKQNLLVSSYTKANEFLRTKITDPFFGFIENKTGLDLTTPETQNLLGSSVLGVGSFGVKVPVKYDVVAGFSSGILTDIKEKPAKNIVLYGAGAGLGFGVGGVTSIIGKVSPVAGGIVRGTSVLGGLGLGGTYAYKTGKDILQSETPSEAGAKFGVATKDIFVLGGGYKTGSKGFDALKGWYGTRGRSFIDIQQGEYPTAPVKKQLKLFQKNLYPELGEKPGAFHTTSSFSDLTAGGKISPTAGSSELPGLYGSTQISTPFSRIQGSGASQSNLNLISYVKNLFAPVGKPGVAYLQPEGFRYSPAKPGKWYLPTKQGYADVPGIKTEIEAIFRPGAGDYLLSGQGYYTKISNVRVPIDSFIYGGSSGTSAGTNLLFNPSGYTLPVSSSSIPSTSIISLVSAGSSSVAPKNNIILEPTSKGVNSNSLISSSLKTSSYKIYSSVRGSSSKSKSYAPSSSNILRSSIISSTIKSSSSSSSKAKSSSRSYGSSSILGSSANRSSSITSPLFKSVPLKMKSKATRQIFKQRTRYQPSFTASILNLRATKKPLLGGGLQLRPIISKPKKIKVVKKSRRKPQTKRKRRRRL